MFIHLCLRALHDTAHPANRISTANVVALRLHNGAPHNNQCRQPPRTPPKPHPTSHLVTPNYDGKGNQTNQLDPLSYGHVHTSAPVEHVIAPPATRRYSIALLSTRQPITSNPHPFVPAISSITFFSAATALTHQRHDDPRSYPSRTSCVFPQSPSSDSHRWLVPSSDVQVTGYTSALSWTAACGLNRHAIVLPPSCTPTVTTVPHTQFPPSAPTTMGRRCSTLPDLNVATKTM